MSRETIVFICVVILILLEYLLQNSRGLNIDKYLLSIILSQSNTVIWLYRYSLEASEYYKE
jgi:hypothetical protein